MKDYLTVFKRLNFIKTKTKQEKDFEKRLSRIKKTVNEAVKEIQADKNRIVFICLSDYKDEDTKVSWRSYIITHEKLLNSHDEFYSWFFFESYENFVKRKFNKNFYIKFSHVLNKKPKNVAVMGICLRRTVTELMDLALSH